MGHQQDVITSSYIMVYLTIKLFLEQLCISLHETIRYNEKCQLKQATASYKR